MSPTNPITQEDRQSNKAREPKQHCHRLHAQNHKLVMRDRIRETPWHYD